VDLSGVEHSLLCGFQVLPADADALRLGLL
jgi:hypothetical protein